MLKELYIENYKSLRNVAIPFKDGLNIIIGKNGSGKTNLLEFIDKVVGIDVLIFNPNKNTRYPEYNFNYVFDYRFGDQYIEMNLQVIDASAISGIKQPSNIYITERNKNDYSHSITSEYNSEDIKNYESITKFNIKLRRLSNINQLDTLYLRYSIPFDVVWLDRHNTIIIELYEQVVSEKETAKNPFYFLKYFFKHFSESFLSNELISKKTALQDDSFIEMCRNFLFDSFNTYKDTYDIDNALRIYSPIEVVRISPNINVYKPNGKILFDFLTLEFKIDNEWVPWSYLSDGTKRLFYLITEICTYDEGIILIEEPELGIHPHQLFELMTFIKEQSRDKQIIISTHSPIVLDILGPDELDRITVAKIERGSTQFHKLSEGQMGKAKEYMQEVSDLSYYWLHSDLEGND